MTSVPPVLMYHGFGQRLDAADPERLFLDLTVFEQQVRLLQRVFRPLRLAEFVDGLDKGSLPARSVVVTIDDGYASTWQAAEILARYGVPAVVFVPSGAVGTQFQHNPTLPPEMLLSAAQLRLLPRMGVDVGVHGMQHVQLAGLPPEELRVHTHEARALMAEILGAPPPAAFAYPFGSLDPAAVSAVRGAGFRVAFGVELGGGRWSLTRRAVARTDTLASVALKSSRSWTGCQRALGAVPALRRTARTLLCRSAL